jgi:hypothetical protein
MEQSQSQQWKVVLPEWQQHQSHYFPFMQTDSNLASIAHQRRLSLMSYSNDSFAPSITRIPTIDPLKIESVKNLCRRHSN